MEMIENRMKTHQFNSRLIFYGKWVGGCLGGLVLEVRMLVNASSMLRMQDQPLFWKIAKPGSSYFSEKTVFAKMIVLFIKTTNRKDGNDRKDYEKISSFH